MAAAASARLPVVGRSAGGSTPSCSDGGLGSQELCPAPRKPRLSPGRRPGAPVLSEALGRHGGMAACPTAAGTAAVAAAGTAAAEAAALIGASHLEPPLSPTSLRSAVLKNQLEELRAEVLMEEIL